MHAILGILILKGQPPPRHLLSESLGIWRAGGFPESQNAEACTKACIHVDTVTLLAILCIRQFAKTNENKNSEKF